MLWYPHCSPIHPFSTTYSVKGRWGHPRKYQQFITWLTYIQTKKPSHSPLLEIESDQLTYSPVCMFLAGVPEENPWRHMKTPHRKVLTWESNLEPSHYKATVLNTASSIFTWTILPVQVKPRRENLNTTITRNQSLARGLSDHVNHIKNANLRILELAKHNWTKILTDKSIFVSWLLNFSFLN